MPQAMVRAEFPHVVPPARLGLPLLRPRPSRGHKSPGRPAGQARPARGLVEKVHLGRAHCELQVSPAGLQRVSPSLSWPSWDMGCQCSHNPQESKAWGGVTRTPWLAEGPAPLGSLHPTQDARDPPRRHQTCRLRTQACRPVAAQGGGLVHLLCGWMIYGPGWGPGGGRRASCFTETRVPGSSQQAGPRQGPHPASPAVLEDTRPPLPFLPHPHRRAGCETAGWGAGPGPSGLGAL